MASDQPGVTLPTLRVLVVDDSAVMRRAISNALATDPTLQVVDTARDGQDALDKITKLQPDVVTLDLEMPVLDGIGVLKQLRNWPAARPAVLVCSTLSSQGSDMALKAMSLGAVDYIEKDPDALGSGDARAKTELLEKIRAVAPRTRATTLRAAPPPRPARNFSLTGKEFDAVVIGSSTGGPPVLETICPAFPQGLQAPVVVAQHMPALFTKSMSERLGTICKLKVVHAEQGCVMEPGNLYITVGGKHSRIARQSGSSRLRLDISDEPRNALYKPCVNELFQSAASLGQACLGIMLTGMGDDGVIGARAMHGAGATILAQSGETCAVYGMPRAVVEANLATASLSPAEIAKAVSLLSGHRNAGIPRAA